MTPLALGILQEHFDELDFLWEQRERVIFALDWTATDLRELEERAEAHLDGLRLGGADALSLARPHLTGEEQGAATAAALTFMATGDERAAGDVLAALRTAPEAAREGIRIALRHTDARLVADGLYDVSVGRDVQLRVVAADVLAFHRLRPPPELEKLLREEPGRVRQLAFGAAGRFGRLSTADVERALRDEDGAVRRAALVAAAGAGVSELPELCRRVADRGFQAVPEAVEMLGVVGEVTDLSLLKSLVKNPAIGRSALAALGALGRVGAVPVLLDAMDDPALGPAAADAFVMLTGISQIPTRPVDDGPEADEDPVPLPDGAQARLLWDRLQDELHPAGVWRAGIDTVEMGLDRLLDVLPLRARRDAYLRARVLGGRAVGDVELEQALALRRGGAG